MTVYCLHGGFDHRFRCGKNTKEDFEHRTADRNWKQDRSIYSRVLSEAEIEEITDPILRQVAEQDLRASRARKSFKRSTLRPSFYDDHPGY